MKREVQGDRHIGLRFCRTVRKLKETKRNPSGSRFALRLHFGVEVNREVRAFPALLLKPEEREDHSSAGSQSTGGQVHSVNTHSGADGVGVVRGPPVVIAPMHQRRSQQRDSQVLSPRHSAAFIVEPPFEVSGPPLLHLIALHRLRRLIKNLAILQGSDQLDVLGVRPDQRAR